MPDQAGAATDLTDAEVEVLDRLDLDRLHTLLGELVASPSVADAESPAQELVAAELRGLGMEVDEWEIDIPSLARHPAYSAEVERQDARGVVGTIGGDGPALMLNGHIDVVPVGDPDAWDTDPWTATPIDGHIAGRGTVDMKGGLACAITAVRAVLASGVDLPGRVSVASVIGEEDGGCGTLATLMRGHTADGAVIMEPTELFVVPAHAGALTFRVTVPGTAAHGCMREEGLSAIEGFVPVHAALLDLERRRNRRVDDPLFARFDLPLALSIGTITGGDWSATVPDHLSFEGRYGVAIGEDLASARAEFEEAVAAAARDIGWPADRTPVVEWWGGQFGPSRTPLDDPIVSTASGAHGGATGAAAEVRGVTYGADMRLLVDEGNIPTVMYGPGDVRRAHTANEAVPVHDLVSTARTLALTILRFCS